MQLVRQQPSNVYIPAIYPESPSLQQADQLNDESRELAAAASYLLGEPQILYAGKKRPAPDGSPQNQRSGKNLSILFESYRGDMENFEDDGREEQSDAVSNSQKDMQK